MSREHKQMFPAWLRLWHWANLAVFVALIVTGFSLHFAGVGSNGMSFRLSVRLHNATGIALAIIYDFYVIAMAVTGHWRQFVPRPGLIRRILLQVRYYIWGIFRGEHHPFPASTKSRFNPIQMLAYLGAVFVFFPLQIISGVALLYPHEAPDKVLGVNGILPMAAIHSLTAYLFMAFLLVHVYLALTVAEENTGIRNMLLGNKLPKDDAAHDEPEPRHAPGE